MLTQPFPVSSAMHPVIGANTLATARSDLGIDSSQMISFLDYGTPGSANDSTAAQAAINVANAAGGGTVFFPPGNYNIGTTLQVSGAVRLLGAGGGNIGGTVFYAGAQGDLQDINVINFTAAYGGVEQMTIYGAGAPVPNSNTTFGASQPIIKLSSGAGHVSLNKLYLYGGAFSIQAVSGSYVTLLSDVVGSYTYGSAFCLIQNCSAYMFRCYWDMDWPVQIPSLASGISAWAANTAVSVGAVVSNGSGYMQCKTAGTTGSSAPSLKNYGTNITDGTAVWLFVSMAGQAALQFDGAVTTAQSVLCDHSACTQYGIAFTENGSNVPENIAIIGATAGINLNNAVSLQYGGQIDLIDCNIGGGLNNGSPTVQTLSTFKGDLSIIGGTMQFGNNCIQINGGINTIIKGVRIAGFTGCAINIEAAVSQFIIDGNTLSTSEIAGSNGVGIQVQSGASDYYIITNNLIHGCTTGVSDGGTGTHKTVTNNW